MRLQNYLTRKMHSSFMAGKKSLAWRNVCQTHDGDNNYKKLRKKLNDYFKSKKNKHHARYVFLKMRPAHDETTNAYAVR